jgi:hypothetical protein
MKFRTDTPDWIREAPRPWVVLDLSVLRSLPAEPELPWQFTVVLPDRLLREIVTSARPEVGLRKLDSILLHPSTAGRVLVGRHLRDLIGRERTPQRVSSGAIGAVHEELSEAIRRVQLDHVSLSGAEVDWSDDPYPDETQRFVEMIDRFAGWLREEHPDSWRAAQFERSRVLAVREETNVIGDLAVAFVSDRYKQRAWRNRLGRFPEEAAVGRWIRILFWYASKHVSAMERKSKVIENDYDDAQYVLLALYTRHLLTRDGGMRAAAEAVSGGSVRVYSDPSAIPRCGFD